MTLNKNQVSSINNKQAYTKNMRAEHAKWVHQEGSNSRSIVSAFTQWVIMYKFNFKVFKQIGLDLVHGFRLIYDSSSITV